MFPSFGFIKIAEWASIGEGTLREAVFEDWHEWICVGTEFYDLVGDVRVNYEFDFFSFFVGFSLEIVNSLEVGEFGRYRRNIFIIL